MKAIVDYTSYKMWKSKIPMFQSKPVMIGKYMPHCGAKEKAKNVRKARDNHREEPLHIAV